MSQRGFSFTKHFKKEHGGSLQKGKRKSARPLSAKHPHHLVLKSFHSAFFNPSLRVLEKLIYAQAAKYRIKIYGLFDLPPYTRIVSWGRELKAMLEYVVKNQLQAWGLISKKESSNASTSKPKATSSKTDNTKKRTGQEQEAPTLRAAGAPQGLA